MAATLSLLLHAAPVAYALTDFLLGDLEMPDIEIELTEVELVDPDMLQGEEVEPVVEPPPPVLQPQPPVGPELPPEQTKDEGADKSEEDKEPEDKRDLSDRRSKVDALGPEVSTWSILLVPQKIRKLSFREQAMDLMVPLPDFDYLITKGGFDPLRDFEHIVIASSDLRDWRQTFLAVDHNLSQGEIQAGIERAAAANDESIEWIEENGIIRGNPKPNDPETPDIDTRWFVLLEDGIAVYTLPVFLPYVTGEAEIDDKRTSGNFVGNLAKLRRFAAKQPSAGMQVVAKDLRSAVRRTNLPFEMPDRIEVSAEAASAPEVMLRAEFMTAADAKAFETWYTGWLGNEIANKTAWKYAVGWIYDQLTIERSGKKIIVWGEFTQAQTERILDAIADIVGKMLHKTPEEIEEARKQRIERWKARQEGKLPPSSLDGEAAEPPTPTPNDAGPADSGDAPAEGAPGDEAPSDPV